MSRDEMEHPTRVKDRIEHDEAKEMNPSVDTLDPILTALLWLIELPSAR
jgi:hypothetical protein